MLLYLIYSVFLVSYMILKTGKNFTLRAANKILLASMYFSNGVFLFLQSGRKSALIPVIAALFFALLGDILLLFIFKLGGISFSVSACIFTMFCINYLIRCNATMSFYLIATVIALVLLVFFTFADKHQWLEYRGGKIFSYAYMVATTLQGALGFSVALRGNTTATLLLGVGLAMFMISDYFLAFYRFPPAKMPQTTVNWLSRISSLAYFPGMLLISASVKYWV